MTEFQNIITLRGIGLCWFLLEMAF